MTEKQTTKNDCEYKKDIYKKPLDGTLNSIAHAEISIGS